MEPKKQQFTLSVFGQSVDNKTPIEIMQEGLELLQEFENEWPIEMDTLDLREHEFNFEK